MFEHIENDMYINTFIKNNTYLQNNVQNNTLLVYAYARDQHQFIEEMFSG